MWHSKCVLFTPVFAKPTLTFLRRHSRAQRVSENFFGVLAQRFRILLRPISALAENVTTLVLACCALYNILCTVGSGNDMQPSRPEDIGGLLPLNSHGANFSACSKGVEMGFADVSIMKGVFHGKRTMLTSTIFAGPA